MAAQPAHVDPDNCICLLCFGRGGSNIVVNLIQNSPDVHSVVIEWHKRSFRRLELLRKLHIRRIPGLGPVQRAAYRLLPKPTIARFWRRRCAAALTANGRVHAPGASRICLKVMDYNIQYLPTIALAYPSVKVAALAREPLAQVESLMRSGASIGAAIARYNDGALAMAASGAPIVRFEDLLADPAAFAYRLHDMLGIARCAPDGFSLKVKPFGAARQSGTNVSTKNRRQFDEAGLREFIAPDVNEKAVARLSPGQAAVIRKGTAPGAAALGYPVPSTLDTASPPSPASHPAPRHRAG